MHTKTYINEAIQIANLLDIDAINSMADEIYLIKKNNGRLFILGVGGSAANASHAVNDFRKLCALEAYAPTDNVSELTARVNDEGWDTTFVEWLKVSRLRESDGVLVLSVGGGNLERGVSINLVTALDYAKNVGSRVLGIVGRDGGHVKKVGDCVLIIPTVSQERVTPHAEAFQAVVWHCLVSNPILQVSATKW
jgi:D-sedoheptulose 7-phosphate isomerase